MLFQQALFTCVLEPHDSAEEGQASKTSLCIHGLVLVECKVTANWITMAAMICEQYALVAVADELHRFYVTCRSLNQVTMGS